MAQTFTHPETLELILEGIAERMPLGTKLVKFPGERYTVPVHIRNPTPLDPRPAPKYSIAVCPLGAQKEYQGQRLYIRNATWLPVKPTINAGVLERLIHCMAAYCLRLEQGEKADYEALMVEIRKTVTNDEIREALA